MKRTIVMVAIVLVATIILSSCGNMSFGLGNFDFERVHIFTHDGHDRCLAIKKWHDNETGIEIETKDFGALFLSEGTYMLCENECPICGKEGNK